MDNTTKNGRTTVTNFKYTHTCMCVCVRARMWVFRERERDMGITTDYWVAASTMSQFLKLQQILSTHNNIYSY